jgi:hypothetical protein
MLVSEERVRCTGHFLAISCSFDRDVVPGHPEVCRLAEALLTEVTGLPVHEDCDRGEIPRCCFEVAGASDAT